MEDFLLRSSNVLLLKDDVGRGRPPAYPLPGEEYRYGKKAGSDMEGVKEGKREISFYI